jgi:hypothetical protein
MTPPVQPPESTQGRLRRLPLPVRAVLVVLIIVVLVAGLTGLALLRGSLPDIVEDLIEGGDRINVQIDTDSVTMPSLPTLRPRATLAPILGPAPTESGGG